MRYQTPRSAALKRTDHVWVRRLSGHGWKCCLCGAVSLRLPPPFPTPAGWMPARYEPLTAEDHEAFPKPPGPTPLSEESAA